MKHKLAFSIAVALLLALAGNAIGQVPAGNWTDDATIGSAAVGNSTLDGDVYSVTGNGDDIWNNADAFQYLYRELAGDGSMTARVLDDGTGSNTWAKGGVMIRESTAAGSVHAMMVMTDTDGGGGSFQWRGATGGASSNSDVGSGIVEPYWVRIERIGNGLSGYISPDGETWTQQGTTQTIVMPENVLIGLCVTSHAAGELRTFQFDNVSVTGGATPFRDPGLASNPIPANNATDIIRDNTLSWTAGAYPGTHNVYFGTSLEDVESATVPAASGLTNTSFEPDRMEFDQVYYWRVDEVNTSADRTVFKGDVWSFTAEPYSIMIPIDVSKATASSYAKQNTPAMTINGSGLVGMEHSTAPEAMWLSNSPDMNPWLMYEFNRIEKLDQMLVWNSNHGSESFIGWGVKGVSIEYSVDGVDWTALAEPTQLDRGLGAPGYDTPQVIDFGLVQAKFVRLNIQSSWGGLLPQYGLAEVQFYGLPVHAREPKPASGSANIRPDAVVTWRAGREAGQHTLYVSDDVNAVADGTAPSVASMTNSADLKPLDLQMSQTYYWRVDEVNDAEAPSVWAGPVWSLNTADALVVEDFESYTNFTPNRPFQAWLDGYGYSADDFYSVDYPGNGTGAGIGHDIWAPSSPYFEGSLMETSITLPGSGKALPFYYTNSGGVVSETQHTFATPQDWTVGGVSLVSIPFHGTPGNTGTLYVKINGVKVVYPRNAGNIAIGGWLAFNIDLSTVNTNLKSVTKLAIGVDGSSASGMILIDDITLHKEAGQIITPADPGTNGIFAKYSFEGNANDVSGKGHNGTLVGNAAFTSDATRGGQVLNLDGIDGCVDLGPAGGFNFGGSFSVCAWVNMTELTANWGHVIMGNRGEDNLGWQLRRHSTTPNLTFTVRGTTGADDPQGTVNVAAMTGEWIQVTAVYDVDAGLRSVYVNGMLDVQIADTGVCAPSTHKVYIGARAVAANTGPEGFFYGMIDDVRVYNRALSAGEALSLAGGTSEIDVPF